MTKLLQKAFQEAQQLSEDLQDEIAQQLLADIENEIKWQKTFANSDTNLDILRRMAKSALIEDQEGKTEERRITRTFSHPTRAAIALKTSQKSDDYGE
ncbi:hypothetical protein VB715_01985 [Crocosphaera sp. UHCC 0190]|uniref:hypothetical protein n=1 Tax=Crocosphaera sp. UHCC 0190 TaxID=3110246 RepID=UPI002B2138DA|nr:hypothetical protein [Crocosphaera sp. UHCC 0190]MEA5508525.1 hypothetical protein [Crocosphaera sp. UHCC 0190]